MALQSSGAISLANLQSEFGGANPISLSEYYRSGAYVPASISAPNRQPASGELYSAPVFVNGGPPPASAPTPGSYYMEYFQNDTTATPTVVWNGVHIAASNFAPVTGGPDKSTYTHTDGFTYYRGTYREAIGETQTSFNFYYHYYALYRQGASGATSVNTGIPSSGTVSLSQFYNGRKT